LVSKRQNWLQRSSLNLSDREDDVLVQLAVHRKFPSLTELTVAARKITLKRFLTSVNVRVFLKVLGKGETFEAQDADVLLRVVRG
jgi:hypothetical protein